MNWVDAVIFIVILASAYHGYLRGAIKQSLDLAVAVISVTMAFIFCQPLGNFLVTISDVTVGFASIMGFMLVWLLVEFAYAVLYVLFVGLIPREVRYSKKNKYWGVLPGILWGILTVCISLSFFSVAYADSMLGRQIWDSPTGKFILSKESSLSNLIEDKLGSAVIETNDFLTLKDQNTKRITLGYTVTDGTIDNVSAAELLVLLNVEREKNNLKPLILDPSLTNIGLAYCQEMFAEGYFSHYSTAGESPFDRMNAAGIVYISAGENLALATNAQAAFDGLMNSPTHRANMLSAEYHRIGIAVIDGGVHGKMFAQEFTN